MKKILTLLFLFTISILQSQNTFTVYFDFNIDTINSKSAQELSNWIAKNQNAQIIKIYGYADPVGTDAYNVNLSERRAKNVLNSLQQKGVAISENLVLKAYGENFNLSDNNTLNRKVTLYFTSPDKQEDTFITAVNKAKKGDVLRIPNLNFYNNSDIILPESKPVLAKLLRILQENSALQIDIQGHICCQEVEQDQVSLRRALATYNYLVRNGIAKNRLSYQSFGSSKPIHKLPEKNEQERKANRRVEIEIIDN
ncbi:OmpA family protein [Flavobacterium litorale]|uniref:OmpA family protein n=1 Tax=Flavobacterium litorale TaxID=2856519 RepID=A0ABX8VAD8_9FLAO|nr:OmpA family protein [Flavobacterium litorale]QYJ68158.1 OmpA family protein [Flavobacterium litorale]